MNLIKIAVKIVLPLIIIMAALFGAYLMVKSKPEPKSKKPAAVIPIVPILTVEPADHAPPVLTFGTVQAQFETNLTAQVPGKITFVSPDFRVGKFVSENTVLIRIDDTDYQAALAREKYNLSLAQRTLAEEEIRAKQAADDWTASGRNLANASKFVLREPQLKAAQENITAIESAIKKAKTDIARTEITAPFDAIVTSRSASLGNLATTQSTLGTLLSSKTAEVRLPLTIEQTARLTLPSSANSTEIKLTTPTAPDAQWSAKLVRTEPSIDPKNQITYVIAEIQNPYAKGKQPLPIGTFVNASIPAKTIQNAYQIPESAIVNDSYIWTTKPNENAETSTLEKQPIQRLFTQDNQAYIRLTESENQNQITLITRPLTTFKPNTKIKPQPPQPLP